MSTLSHQEARRVYDRIGSLHDSQAFYENPAVEVLLHYAHFASASAVFEFGCGTGRFAALLLEKYLSLTARYRGVDVSPRMVRLTEGKLTPYAPRAEVSLSDGRPPVDEPTGSCDRFVSNYVFDLLSEEDVHAVLREAHRMLRPRGLLCLSGLSSGVGLGSRVVAQVWRWIQFLRPSLVGGCRPVDLLPFLAESQWQIRHHARVVSYAVPSEVVVAERR